MDSAIAHLLDEVTGAAPAIFAGLLVFAGFWIASALARLVMVSVIRRAHPGKPDLWIILGDVVRYGIILFGAVTGFGTMGVDITALVAGLGLAGFGLGFALRDMLANFVAGVLVLFFQPFSRGDRIRVLDFEGQVVEINLRYTVLDAAGDKLLVPNGTMLAHPIRVFRAGPG